MTRVEPTDAQLPHIVAVQATGLRAFLDLAEPFCAAARPAAGGRERIPRGQLGQLVAVARKGLYAFEADPQHAPGAAGQPIEKLRELWRLQHEAASHLFGLVGRWDYAAEDAPDDPATALIPAEELRDFRETVGAVRRVLQHGGRPRARWAFWKR